MEKDVVCNLIFGVNDLPQKRSRQGQTRADARYQRYYDLLLLKMIEKQRIKDNTYHDERLAEQVNTIVCHEHPIHQGEVLIDSRIRGYYQKIKPFSDSMSSYHKR